MKNLKDEATTYFVATTALEDFWDKSKPIIFLGEWCMRHSRKEGWENLDHKVVTNMWEDVNKHREAFYYILDLYERVLDSLGNSLNTLHGVNYSNRYWRILLGPWLYHYLSSTYDRFLSIKMIMTDYGQFETMGLKEESFFVPEDTIEFISLINDDPYNLQFYTKIMTFFNIKFEKKYLDITPEQIGYSGPITLKKKFSDKINEVLKSIVRLVSNKNSILMTLSNFRRNNILKMTIGSCGKILPFEFNNSKKIGFMPVNQESRLVVKNFFNINSNNEFEIFLSTVIANDIPKCFIEGYNEIKRGVEKNYPLNIKALFTVYGWYFDETFKQWAGMLTERGVHLLGAQHGGNYGVEEFFFFDRHETKISDRFYSWGWDRFTNTANIVPMPAPKLVDRNKIEAHNNFEGILYTTTSITRYLVRFQEPKSFSDNYENWQKRFVCTISSNIRERIRIRLHGEMFGRDYDMKWKELKYGHLIESYDSISFLESMTQCRIYVCDHLSTTFLEALSANKPTILFWDPEMFVLNSEAEVDYSELRRMGILYYTPEEAAVAINRIYPNVEEWWNDNERQEVIINFCKKYVLVSDSALNQWLRELKKI
ncbi:MAG: LIC12162 family protein [Clostridia bacterium]|nr:LIC12162 family protein [Clostridia bacterium]